MSTGTIQIAKDEGIAEIRRIDETDRLEITLFPHRSDLYLPRRRCQ